MHLGRFFVSPPSVGPVRPISTEGVCGASPLAAPAGLSLRSAPRRAQRAASEERASNERATSAERARWSLGRPSRFGRSALGRLGRFGRSALGGRSVVSRGAALRGPSAAPAGVGPNAVRPLRRGGVGGGAVPKPPEAGEGECVAAKPEHGAPAAGARRGRRETSRGRGRAEREAPKGPRPRHRRRRAAARAARTAADRRAQGLAAERPPPPRGVAKARPAPIPPAAVPTRAPR